jgi:hypothetical protein
MMMFRTGNDVELLDHRPPEPILRKHPADRLLDGERRLLREQVLVEGPGDAAGVSGVAPGDLLLLLAAREHDLGGIDDDEVVADVHVGGEHRLVLATKDHRRLRGDTPEHLLAGVHDVPAALDVVRLG